MKSENSQEFETVIAREQVVSAVASWLQAMRVVKMDEIITDIQFIDLVGVPECQLIPVKIFIEKEKEVEVKHRNG